MPEAPEVERVREVLAARVEGATLEEVRTVGRRLVRRHDPELLATVVGRPIVSMRRIGKFLVFDLDTDALVVHLGMAGRLVVSDSSATATHVQLVLDFRRTVVTLVDPRTFSEAFVDVLGTDGRPRRLAGLGPDVFGPEEEVAASLERHATRSRRAIKTALLDQRVVAGLGNMYADETLFRVGVHPSTPMNALGRRLVGIAEVAGDVAREALAAGGTTFADRAYRDPLDRPGAFGARLAVYQRAGSPCPRCGTSIVRRVLQGRSAHWCPRCQQGGS